MKYANKYNELTKTETVYELPEGSALLADLGAEVSCASCGKTIVFGYGYTSMTIQTESGFGYAVCSDCYQIEMENRFNFNKD